MSEPVKTESVLIDGVVYTLPIEVACELLCLNIELLTVQKDAARYRWLRGDWFEFGMHNINTAIGAAHHRISKVGDVETLDAAIDAAIAPAST